MARRSALPHLMLRSLKLRSIRPDLGGGAESVSPPVSALSAASPEPEPPDAHSEVPTGVLACVPPSGSIILGCDLDSGEDVYLVPEAQARSVYCLGKIGAGKTTLLLSTAYQYLRNGDGFGFFDPHGDAYETLLAHVPQDRATDVIAWDPADRARPFGLNPLSCSDPALIDSRADHFVTALASLAEFAEIFESAPVMRNTLHHWAITVTANDALGGVQGATVVDAPRFLSDRSFRERFYPALASEYPQVLAYWDRLDKLPDRERRDRLASTLNKVERFGVNRILRGIFGQPTSSLCLREIMDGGKVLLVKLSSHELGADTAAFIGAFLVNEILQAALSRADTPPSARRPWHLIADEFQTYMTTAFPKLIAEARKYALDCLVANQARAQLRDAETRSTTLVVGNLVLFSLNGHDAAELAAELDATPPPPEVVGTRPLKTIHQNPVKHLVEQGHRDERATKFVGTIRHLQDRASEGVSRLLDRTFSADQIAALERSMRQAAGTLRSLNMYFVRRMQGEYVAGALLVILMDLPGFIIFCEALSQTVVRGDQRYRELLARYLAGPTDGQAAEDALTYARQTWAEDEPEGWEDSVRSAMAMVRDFFTELNAAGDALESAPILTNSGEEAEILGTPRSYADVQQERANRLTTLPAYTARCALLRDGERREYTIRPYRIEELADDPATQFADPLQIIQRSRQVFGQSSVIVRREVTKETKRIALDDIVNNKTRGSAGRNPTEINEHTSDGTVADIQSTHSENVRMVLPSNTRGDKMDIYALDTQAEAVDSPNDLLQDDEY